MSNYWRPIKTAPRDGTWIILAGPSGYCSTSLRAEICHYDAEFRPRQPWVNHSGDSFLDGGEEPTHWLPLPPDPKLPADEFRPEVDILVQPKEDEDCKDHGYFPPKRYKATSKSADDSEVFTVDIPMDYLRDALVKLSPTQREQLHRIASLL